MYNKKEKDHIAELISQGLTHRRISEVTGVPISSISRWRNEGYKKAGVTIDLAPKDTQNGDSVLVIGDIHEPCSRKGYLEFCQSIQKKYNTNKTVIIGDIIDSHAISYHAANPVAPSPMDEYELTLQGIHRWHDAFPTAWVCLGNHDKRVARLAESVNIPQVYLRKYADVWDTPGWQWVTKVEIDGVRYFHGEKCSGINPAYNASKKRCQSVVIGHCHSRGGIKWTVNDEKRFFGMDVGSGVDDDAWAFIYAEEMIEKSVISCGVVINGMPYHEMMPLEKYK